VNYLRLGALLGFFLHLSVAVAQTGPVVVDHTDPLLRLLTTHPQSRFAVAAELISNPELISTEEIRRQTAVSPMKHLFRASKTAQAALEFVLQRREGTPAPTRATRDAEAPPNIVLIHVDGLRPAALGAYGAKADASPRMDALAAAGALFVDVATAGDASLPAAVSLFTALAPEQHGIVDGVERGKQRLGIDKPTMAAVLNEVGYDTAGFFTHPSFDGIWGHGRGFELYEGRRVDAVAQMAHARLWLDWHAFHVARGIESEPFFLFVELSDLRDPRGVPEAYRALVVDEPDAAAAEYAAAVRYVDDQIGILHAAIAATGIAADTVFVVVGGPAPARVGKPPAASGAVPLILQYPAKVDAGQRIAGKAKTVDIMPTLLGFAGGAAVPGVAGIDLAPFLRRPGGEEIDAVPRADTQSPENSGPLVR